MFKYEFKFTGNTKILPAEKVSWQAPSNIALIKYWGKFGTQLPKNPSLSFTLTKCATQTSLSFFPKTRPSKHIDFEVIFKGNPAPSFHPKIQTFFERIKPYLPFITSYSFKIETGNSFPHSSGIASSASGMAALALCLMNMESKINPSLSQDYFYKKASFLARLGSGSASRSMRGPLMLWGKHPNISHSSEYFSIKPNFFLHSNFENYQDCILLVDKGEKQVSSSLGHDLMKNHPFAESRFSQAEANLSELIDSLKTGNLKKFIALTEHEALTLHAMMMTSSPYFILMKPQTLKIIQHIWDFRKTSDCNLCFTLDAGANVHLLYPEKEKKQTLRFVDQVLSPYCQDGHYIEDQLGEGAFPITF